jgi:hypothetical protein
VNCKQKVFFYIFLQNAIPTYVAKDMVLVYLEDVRDAKEVPGLNRLEYSVQEGYLNPTHSQSVLFSSMLTE